MTNPGFEVAGGVRPLHRALSKVAHGLARAHGQRQFYTLDQVHSQAVAARVDAGLTAWVFAAFVTRDDFEALFAVRETPGGCAELRAAMSAPELRAAPGSMPREFADKIDQDDLWWCLQLVADVSDA